MATGKGKTITAVAASARLYEREGRLAVIIAVPYQHLVDQWREESEALVTIQRWPTKVRLAGWMI
jgi:superfamily II DNA or RNA helicase